MLFTGSNNMTYSILLVNCPSGTITYILNVCLHFVTLNISLWVYEPRAGHPKMCHFVTLIILH